MSCIRHKRKRKSSTRLKVSPSIQAAGPPRIDRFHPPATRSPTMPQALTEQLSREQQIAALEKDWATNPRWKGIERGYTAADVVRLRGSFPIEHTIARRTAEKLWALLHSEPYVNCLGALTG